MDCAATLAALLRRSPVPVRCLRGRRLVQTLVWPGRGMLRAARETENSRKLLRVLGVDCWRYWFQLNWAGWRAGIATWSRSWEQSEAFWGKGVQRSDTRETNLDVFVRWVKNFSWGKEQIEQAAATLETIIKNVNQLP